MRTISFEQAKARYVHRFTMQHVPAWALQPVDMTINGQGPCFHAPQFRSDREWYENTKFPGESPLADKRHCYTTDQTWPLGCWLLSPYRRG
ncbi:hypothetical protein [Bradyrhizobium elkanii]|uniref:hypothetical protein n=1 Tax=Bradyrhizobium elkanii TaxID=29448 RepID=UPI003518EB68